MKRFLSLIMAVSFLLVPAALVNAEGEGQTEELVEIAQGKPCFTNWQYNDLLTDYATDGNESTAFANSRVASYFYVDFGAEYKLEQVKVLMANMGDPNKRCGFDMYLSNARPKTADYDENKIKIHTQTEDPGFTEYFTVEVSEEAKTIGYRYLAFETTTNAGLSISELKAYVKPENVVENVTHWVEVGRDKAIFANTASVGAEAWRINDGGTNTLWANRYMQNTIRIVMDLGAAMPIKGFVYLPRWDMSTNFWDCRGFTVYGSNDMELVEKTALYTADPLEKFSREELNLLEVDEEKANTPYRYIVIEKSQKMQADAQAAGQPSYKTEDLSISHFQVYSSSDYAAAIAEGKQVSKRSYEVSLDKKTFTTDTYGGSGAEAVDNQYHTGWTSRRRDVTYIYVDLGQPIPVDYVALASGPLNAGWQDGAYRKGFKIVGTNDPDFSADNDDVLYDIGDPFGAQANESGLVIFRTDEAFRDKTYRYVGVRSTAVPPEPNTAIELNAFNVYTNADKFDAVFEPVTATRENSTIKVSTKAVASKSKTYQILAACYDGEGRLIAAKRETASPGVGTTTAISKNITFDAAVMDNTSYVKVMLFDANLVPIQTLVRIDK